MRLIAFFLFVFASQIASSQTSDKLETDRGILGYRLGYPRDSIKGITRTGKTQGLEKFRPVNDTIFWRGIRVEALNLYFFRDSLHSVIVKVMDGRDSEKVKSFCEQLYGPGEKLDQFGTRHFWRSENIILNFEENMVSGSGTLSFFHIPLVNHLERHIYDKRYGKLE